MADLRIDDATRDDVITGNEIIPVSDGGVPKSVLTASLADYIFQLLPQKDSTSALESADSFVVVKENVTKVAQASQVCNLVAQWLFSQPAKTPVDATKVALADSSLGTITYEELVAAVSESIDADLILNSLASTGTVVGTDEVAIISESGKKVSATIFAKYVLATLGSYIASVAEQAPQDTQYLILSDGVAVTKATVSAILAKAGNVVVSGTPSSGKVPVWGDNKALRDGFTVDIDTMSESESSLPTSKAVKNAISSAINEAMDDSDALLKPTTFTPNNLVSLGENCEVNSTTSIATTIRATNIATDTSVASEKAVRALAETINGKIDELTLDTIGEPTDVVENNASVDAHGLLPKLSGSQDDFLRGDGTWKPLTKESASYYGDYIMRDDKAIPAAIEAPLQTILSMPANYTSNAPISVRIVWKSLVASTTVSLKVAASIVNSGSVPSFSGGIDTSTTINEAESIIVSDVISITPSGSNTAPSMLSIAISDNGDGTNAALVGVYVKVPVSGNNNAEVWL